MQNKDASQKKIMDVAVGIRLGHTSGSVAFSRFHSHRKSGPWTFPASEPAHLRAKPHVWNFPLSELAHLRARIINALSLDGLVILQTVTVVSPASSDDSKSGRLALKHRLEALGFVVNLIIRASTSAILANDLAEQRSTESMGLLAFHLGGQLCWASAVELEDGVFESRKDYTSARLNVSRLTFEIARTILHRYLTEREASSVLLQLWPSPLVRWVVEYAYSVEKFEYDAINDARFSEDSDRVVSADEPWSVGVTPFSAYRELLADECELLLKLDRTQAQQASQRLLEAAERTRIAFSSPTQLIASVKLERFWQSTDLQVSIARSDVWSVAEIGKLTEILNSTVHIDRFRRPIDVKCIVVSGQGCSLPEVKKCLQERFPNAKLVDRLPCTQVLALGAHVQARVLCGLYEHQPESAFAESRQVILSIGHRAYNDSDALLLADA